MADNQKPRLESGLPVSPGTPEPTTFKNTSNEGGGIDLEKVTDGSWPGTIFPGKDHLWDK